MQKLVFILSILIVATGWVIRPIANAPAGAGYFSDASLDAIGWVHIWDFDSDNYVADVGSVDLTLAGGSITFQDRGVTNVGRSARSQFSGGWGFLDSASEITLPDQGTLFVWAYRTDDNNGEYNWLRGYNTDNSLAWRIRTDEGDAADRDRLEFQTYNSTGGGAITLSCPTKSQEANKWTLVIVSYDHTNDLASIWTGEDGTLTKHVTDGTTYSGWDKSSTLRVLHQENYVGLVGIANTRISDAAAAALYNSGNGALRL